MAFLVKTVMAVVVMVVAVSTGAAVSLLDALLMVAPAPERAVLANHPADLHVDLVVGGVAGLDVLLVNRVTAVGQPARLKYYKKMKVIIKKLYF